MRASATATEARDEQAEAARPRRRPGGVRAADATPRRHAAARRGERAREGSGRPAGNETPAGGPPGPPHPRAATHPPGAADGGPEADHDAGALRGRHRPPGPRGPLGIPRRQATGCATPAARHRGRNRHVSTTAAPQPTPDHEAGRAGSATAAEPRPLSPARQDRDGGAAARSPARDSARAGDRATPRHRGHGPGRRHSSGTGRRADPRPYASRRSATSGGGPPPNPTARRRSRARVTPNSTVKTSSSWTCPSRTPESGGTPSRVSTCRTTSRSTAAGSSGGDSWSWRYTSSSTEATRCARSWTAGGGALPDDEDGSRASRTRWSQGPDRRPPGPTVRTPPRQEPALQGAAHDPRSGDAGPPPQRLVVARQRRRQEDHAAGERHPSTSRYAPDLRPVALLARHGGKQPGSRSWGSTAVCADTCPAAT